MIFWIILDNCNIHVYGGSKKPWEEIHVSLGMAAYDPDIDETVENVFVHADHLMYENKRQRKKKSK